MTFLNSALLFGLFALIVPPIIHLLNRRRFEVVDWAAMQFLQVSRKTRRQVILEHVILLLLRLGLIAVLVAAVATPVLRVGCVEQLPGGTRLARMAGQSNRDIVIVIDGSYSMDYRWREQTANDAAKIWAKDFLKDLSSGDQVAVLQAKQQPIAVLGILTADLNDVRTKIDGLPRPRGSIDWAKTIQEAYRILNEGKNPQKEIIVLTDGQRHGWADSKSLEGWQLLALGQPKAASPPRVWIVNVVPDRPDDAPNWFVSPISANRSVATVGRDVKFKFDLQAALPTRREGDDRPPPEAIEPPKKVYFEVDGRPAGDKTPPRSRDAIIGMNFSQRFSTTGSHLVSIQISEDALPGDNRRDFAIEVLPAIPVLIVDGEGPGQVSARGSDFFRYAVAPINHPQPSFIVRAISIQEFASQMLTSAISPRDPWTAPRVLVLQNVPELSDAQHKMVEEFLKNGGGVLVALGPRFKADSYNLNGFRDGDGWLPAQIVTPTGDANDLKKAAYPVAESVEKTFLDSFKEADPESFLKSYFARYWKVETGLPGTGSAVARLSTGDALFVEKSFGKGRVLLATVPLDDSWRTNFLQSHDFVRLCHECLYHLAAARSNEVNLEARQPIVFRPGDGEPPGGVTIDLPEGPRRRIDVASWPLVYEDTRETGVYKLTTDSGKVQYYVVQPDIAESVLTTCSDADRKAVASLFPDGRFLYEQDRSRIMKGLRQSQSDPELWWVFLLLVIGFLVAELAYTRALVKKNPPVMD